MTRLIDADKLKEHIDKLPALPDGNFAGTHRNLKALINMQPIVDAVPVRHGEWNCGDDMFEYAICSACKWDSGEAWEYAKKNFIYCPNCGARMDAEVKDNG